jgi:2-dehydro-3-deoxygluconokinase
VTPPGLPVTAPGLIVTVGEAMALLEPPDAGPWTTGTAFKLRVCGAESNFAIAFSRLGGRARWISRIGNDPFGELIVKALRDEGVDVSYVALSKSAPTGIMVKCREPGRASRYYYRSGSAASQLGPGDLPPEALEDAVGVHLTGITTSLGEPARDMVHRMAHEAHAKGLLVTFDPNYREELWPHGPGQALAGHRDLLPCVSWYLGSAAEAQLLFDVGDPASAFSALEDSGVGAAVLRVGARGAMIRDEDGQLLEIPPEYLETVRDEIGAGDGFAAGFTWALLEDWPLSDCVRAANAVAASALRGTGDWETYLRLDELLSVLTGSGEESTNVVRRDSGARP